MSRGNLRSIRKRIDSTESTMQITKAMQMVATARLNKIQKQWKGIKDFSFYTQTILKHFPLLKTVFTLKIVTLILAITPDMGLAGSFPSDLIKEALTIKQNTEDFKGFLVIGSKGYFSLKNEGILLTRTNLYDIPKVDHAEFLAEDLFEIMRENNISKVKVLYGKFKNALVQLPSTFDLLPIKREHLEIDTKDMNMNLLKKKFLKVLLIYMFYQSYTNLFLKQN